MIMFILNILLLIHIRLNVYKDAQFNVRIKLPIYLYVLYILIATMPYLRFVLFGVTIGIVNQRCYDGYNYYKQTKVTIWLYNKTKAFVCKVGKFLNKTI